MKVPKLEDKSSSTSLGAIVLLNNTKREDCMGVLWNYPFSEGDTFSFGGRSPSFCFWRIQAGKLLPPPPPQHPTVFLRRHGTLSPLLISSCNPPWPWRPSSLLQSRTICCSRRVSLEFFSISSLYLLILCANQHRLAGKVGSRINKNTGELEETKNIEKVRGAFYNNLVVKHVVLESKALERLVTENVRETLLARIKNLHMCFQTVQTNATLTSYTKIMHSQTPMPNNATINETGFKVMDHMRGRFPYGKLLKVHLLLVQAEIRHRGGEVDPKMKIRKLGQYLKTLDIENQRKTYKERTGVDARDDDLNTTTFKPCCETTEYNALLRKDWLN